MKRPVLGPEEFLPEAGPMAADFVEVWSTPGGRNDGLALALTINQANCQAIVVTK
jgi:hypothetical protein